MTDDDDVRPGPYTTGEVSRIDPRELEANIVSTNRKATAVAAGALVALTFAVLATLGYTVSTLHLLETATGPEAQERSAERLAGAIRSVGCDRRRDLEAALNALAAELSAEDPPPTVTVDWPTRRCDGGDG